jgi:hypothetical protein
MSSHMQVLDLIYRHCQLSMGLAPDKQQGSKAYVDAQPIVTLEQTDLQNVGPEARFTSRPFRINRSTIPPEYAVDIIIGSHATGTPFY